MWENSGTDRSRTGKISGLFCRDSEFFIPWAKVIRIGPDIILVEFDEKEMKHRIKDKNLQIDRKQENCVL